MSKRRLVKQGLLDLAAILALLVALCGLMVIYKDV
jgi:hypothetical protein